jgi:hypothetical protein
MSTAYDAAIKDTNRILGGQGPAPASHARVSASPSSRSS